MARVLFLAILLFLGLGGISRADPPPAEETPAPAEKPRKKHVDFAVRLGQGGFKDGRSPIGKLGGGQLAVDVKLHRFPLALSLTGEYYTNGPAPTHSYEIADLTAVNLLYVRRLGKRFHAFVGGGLGTLLVPRDDIKTADDRARGIVYNLEGGIRFRIYRAFGIYGIGKYLYARKKRGDGHLLIDFSEGIGLVGLSLEFSI